MKEYSLWITPQGESKSRLESVIKDANSKFNGPDFEPHMTLLGPIPLDKEEIIEKTKIIVDKIAPFGLALGKVDYSSTYFQCVFVRVKTSVPLLEARMAAQEIFNIKSFFMPHISLFYGNVTPKERSEIANNFKIPEISFVVDRLILTPATLEPSEWEHTAEILFKG